MNKGQRQRKFPINEYAISYSLRVKDEKKYINEWDNDEEENYEVIRKKVYAIGCAEALKTIRLQFPKYEVIDYDIRLL